MIAGKLTPVIVKVGTLDVPVHSLFEAVSLILTIVLPPGDNKKNIVSYCYSMAVLISRWQAALSPNCPSVVAAIRVVEDSNGVMPSILLGPNTEDEIKAAFGESIAAPDATPRKERNEWTTQ